MRKTLALAMAVILVAGSAVGQKKAAENPDKKAVLATVHQFVDGFNKGDTKSALATCASPAAIIDEFPPFAWSGPNACDEWAKDFDAAAKKDGMTDAKVWMGAPTTVDVAGDRAYVIAPTKFSYKVKGKATTEPPARLTIALQKKGNDWKIVAWTWSKS